MGEDRNLEVYDDWKLERTLFAVLVALTLIVFAPMILTLFL